MTRTNGGQRRDGETLVFTCAGASHTGQVANRTGIELRRAGEGTLFCVAALAAEIPDKLERTRKAAVCVAVDGCEDRCSKKILQKLGLDPDVHVVITDLGVEKQPDVPTIIDDTLTTLAAVRKGLAELQ
jgi:uncharacterized metal-binding protein